jgi:5-formyltetrahydrofolate cyclo-ligase
MTKAVIRKEYKTKRLSLTESERMKLDDLMLIQFQKIVFANDVASILSYWPLQQMGEVNTHLFTDFMEFRIPGLQMAFTKLNDDMQTMQACWVNEETTFALNKFGIAEPVNALPVHPFDIDVVLTPLLAFDVQGYRVGYGKGYYDKYLAQCKANVLKIGFSYFEPLTTIDDVDEFDVPLNICITPQRIYEF